ncbi:MAG: cation:proton antiporter [Candidatus Bathyarchaeia archaeon]
MTDATLVFLLATVIIVIGAVSSYLFRRTGIPDMLFLVLLGIAVGPGLGLISAEQIESLAPFLAVLAVVIILFDGGLGLSIHKVVAQAPRATALAVFGFTFNVVVVMFFAKYFMGLRLLDGALLGSILGGGSSVIVIGVARQLGIGEEGSITLILESSITDVLCVVGALTLIGIISAGMPPSEALVREVSAKFTTGLVLGAVAGLAWLSILPKLVEEPYRYMVTLAAIFLTYFASETLGGSGAISALMFGIVLANSAGIRALLKRPGNEVVDGSFRRLEAEIVFLVKAFFFVYLGLIVTLGKLDLILLALILSILLLATRSVVVSMSTVKSGMAKERGTMTLICGRGLAAAVLSVLPAQYGLFNAELYPPVTLLVIIFTAIITSIGAARSRKTTVPVTEMPK